MNNLLGKSWLGEGWFWYWAGMRRKYQPKTNLPDATSNMAALTKANFDLLVKLVPWLDANDKVQRRFRYAVIHKLTRIEAAISLILVGQQAQMQSKPPWYFEDKLREDAKAAEEFISKQSLERGIDIVKYVYEQDTEAPLDEPRRSRGRKWTGWEI